MAAITVTAASVAPVATDPNVVIDNGTAGETITQGQSVYKKASDGRYWLGDANATSPTNAVNGIALNGASAGQPLAVQTAGQITIGGTVVVGKVYVLGATAGDVCPVTDLTSGWYTCIIGVGISVTVIQLKIFNSGVAVP